MKKYIFIIPAILVFLGGQSVSAQERHRQSIDNFHQSIQNTLQKTADSMNSWFGEPQADQPAEAKLRVILDHRWDKHDGFSIKPRLRGSLKLPTLKDRLNIVFGDESIDNELQDAAEISTQTATTRQNKTFDSRRSRRENSTVGLQWKLPQKKDHFSTRLSLGLRSGGDIYGKVKIAKNYYYRNDIKMRSDWIYRYGSKSEHFVRSNIELSHEPGAKPVSKSQLRLEYQHNDDNEQWSWGNTLSREHPTGDDTWFNYGIYTGGYIKNGQFSLNSYGPFAGFRMHVYRKWLFIQPEIIYYNDKQADYDHHIGIMMRLEAQF